MKQLKESILDNDFDVDDMVVDVPKLKNPEIFSGAITDINRFNHCAFLNMALLDVKDAIQRFIDNCKEYGFEPDDFGINRSPIENHIHKDKLEVGHFIPVKPIATEKELKQFIKMIVDLDGLFAKHIPNYTRMTRKDIHIDMHVQDCAEGNGGIIMFKSELQNIVSKLDGLKVGKMALSLRQDDFINALSVSITN